MEVRTPLPGARLLIVDDETTTRLTLMKAFELMGYQVDGAASGQEALEKLSARVYDLMLLDLRMPGIDGVEVMRRMQGQHPDVLVIILTAYATLESAIAAVKAGAVDYLLKPCSIQEIAQAVAKALEKKKAQLHRQHLIQVMQDALVALQKAEAGELLEEIASEGVKERFLRCGPVTLDTDKNLALVGEPGQPHARTVELTESEARLLACLMRRPNQVLSPKVLAREALDYEVTDYEARSLIRPHLSRLRRKLEPDPSKPSIIRTVRGKGYMFAP